MAKGLRGNNSNEHKMNLPGREQSGRHRWPLLTSPYQADSDPVEVTSETQRHIALGTLVFRLPPGQSWEPSKLYFFFLFLKFSEGAANMQREAVKPHS